MRENKVKRMGRTERMGMWGREGDRAEGNRTEEWLLRLILH